MSFGMRYEGTLTVSKKLRRLASNAESQEKVWPKVGSYLSRAIQRQFITEGAYFNTPWKPLKPNYRKWKMQQGLSRKILRQTGMMMRTFTGRPMDIEEYYPHEAVFGSSNPKAAWHHYGTRRNGKRVNPPRKIVSLPRFVKEDVKQLIADHLMEGVTR